MAHRARAAGALRRLEANGAGFEAVALPHLGAVQRFARFLTGDAMAADDLAQQTYLNAMRGWHTFRPGTDARPWLFTICRNTWSSTRRRERPETSLDDDGNPEAVLPRELLADATAERMLARRDLREAIGRALSQLPEPFRLAVTLVDVAELDYQEAADQLGVPIGTVRSRLYRGRRLMQEMLRDEARDHGLLGATEGP